MYNDHVKTVNITEFKTHCLRLLEEASQTGEMIEVAKRGKTIGTYSPKVAANVSYEPGQFKDQIRIVSDLDDFGVEWEALK